MRSRSGIVAVAVLLAATLLGATPTPAQVPPESGRLPTLPRPPAALVARQDPPVELPGGGRVLFPGRRLVALYGHPGAPSLGVLGEQGVTAAIRRAEQVARPYRALSSGAGGAVVRAHRHRRAALGRHRR